MASSQELSNFLRDVERRAYKQTLYAVRDEHAALDIVQDSMLKLAEKYTGQGTKYSEIPRNTKPTMSIAYST